MSKSRILYSLVLLMVGILVIPAWAIIWSGPDDGAHPWVGLVVFDVEGVPSHRCSGTLLSPTVLLTAGHCTDGTSGARVWFDQEVTDSGYPFACVDSGLCSEALSTHTHPDFDGTLPSAGDVGVVILASSIDPSGSGTFGELPEVGALNGLDRQRGRKNQDFTIVGYGVQSLVPFVQVDLVRYVGFPQLVELASALSGGQLNIHLTGNPGKDHPGGACFGDSGGPAFVPGSDTVVAGVGSFVLNQNCVGSNSYYRVDTDTSQDFIESVVP